MESAREAAEWLWALIFPILAWAFKIRRDDLKQLREEIAMKADKEDLERHEGKIDKLFDKQDELSKDMATGFAQVSAELHAGQMAIMQELGKKADK